MMKFVNNSLSDVEICRLFPWKLNGYSYGVQFGINCTALGQSKLSNFVECTINNIILSCSQFPGGVVVMRLTHDPKDQGLILLFLTCLEKKKPECP